jgi:hypothetical protein
MNAGEFLIPAIHEIAVAAEFAIATGAGEKSDTNALTQRPALDAGTNSIDPSHDFMPRNARPVDRKERFDSGGIRMAHPARLNSNTHLPWTGIQKRLCNFGEFSWS